MSSQLLSRNSNQDGPARTSIQRHRRRRLAQEREGDPEPRRHETEHAEHDEQHLRRGEAGRHGLPLYPQPEQPARHANERLRRTSTAAVVRADRV